jgi:hypothetical protein
VGLDRQRARAPSARQLGDPALDHRGRRHRDRPGRVAAGLEGGHSIALARDRLGLAIGGAAGGAGARRLLQNRNTTPPHD